MYSRGPYKRYKIDCQIPVPRRTEYRIRQVLLDMQDGGHLENAQESEETNVLVSIKIKECDTSIYISKFCPVAVATTDCMINRNPQALFHLISRHMTMRKKTLGMLLCLMWLVILWRA